MQQISFGGSIKLDKTTFEPHLASYARRVERAVNRIRPKVEAIPGLEVKVTRGGWGGYYEKLLIADVLVKKDDQPNSPVIFTDRMNSHNPGPFIPLPFVNWLHVPLVYLGLETDEVRKPIQFLKRLLERTQENIERVRKKS